MPVGKTSPAQPEGMAQRGSSSTCASACGHHGWMHHGTNHFGRKIIATLFGILMVYGIVFVGTLIRNNLQEYYVIGRAPRAERLIRLEGQGRVTVKPDIAVTSMGMIASASTVADAQSKNSAVMNTLVERLKALGIDEKDIQTANYNIYPQYTYRSTGERELDAYEVSQTVTIKVRDLTKANQVLALAGEVGANSVSGLSFIVDDPEVYKAEARQLALEKITAKAKALSGDLDVRFVSVYSYDENDGGSVVPYYRDMATGLGGGGSPDVQAGSNEVMMNVGVTFEVR